MPTIDQLFSVLKDFLPLIAAGGTVVSAAGLIPRIGPGRAVWIALRSRFAFKPKPESLRFGEIKLLRSMLADRDFGQGYLVVTGEKGVGKTCLLNTVTSKTAGVIQVKALPSDNERTIISNTLQELANPLFKFVNPLKSAPRRDPGKQKTQCRDSKSSYPYITRSDKLTLLASEDTSTTSPRYAVPLPSRL